MQQKIVTPQAIKNSSPFGSIKEHKEPLNSKLVITTCEIVELKIQRIFRDFSLNSITFNLFLINCIVWMVVNMISYWGGVQNWDCMQYFFFAKFQPSITYNHEIWRLILSSFMFGSWIQFYINNFTLNMMGYVIEKQSKLKFLVIFYGGILAGHMFSCCLSDPGQLTVGTSCGTIALLPIELQRFIKLRKTNPLQAKSRLKFLAFNIASNFILNFLAIFGIGVVDWISHIGCLIPGTFMLIYFTMKQIQGSPQKYVKLNPIVPKIIRLGISILLVSFYLVMGVIIWKYEPAHNIGKSELERMNFLCNQNL